MRLNREEEHFSATGRRKLLDKTPAAVHRNDWTRHWKCRRPAVYNERGRHGNWFMKICLVLLVVQGKLLFVVKYSISTCRLWHELAEGAFGQRARQILATNWVIWLVESSSYDGLNLKVTTQRSAQYPGKSCTASAAFEPILSRSNLSSRNVNWVSWTSKTFSLALWSVSFIICANSKW